MAASTWGLRQSYKKFWIRVGVYGFQLDILTAKKLSKKATFVKYIGATF